MEKTSAAQSKKWPSGLLDIIIHCYVAGEMLVIWLKQVLNAIVEMEKDNYCRIALTPVITKLLGVHNPCPLAANPGRARSAFTEADCIQKAHNL